MLNSELPFFFTMESFVEFVTDKRIIECLCRKRASEAGKRHDAHHHHALSSDKKIPDVSHIVYSLTPPRRQWIHLGEKGRLTAALGGRRQTISTEERTYRSVLWTIIRDMENASDAPYLQELKSFIRGLKDRIQDPDYSIETPRTIPILKKRKDGAKDEYRPICLFENLYDAIIIILSNRYLSKLFDGYFYEDSLAFRPKRRFHGKIVTTFHHDAISLITNYLEHNSGRSIYVAECDMQKFYDTVNHEVVREEFSKLITLSREDNPGICFDEITHIFNSYLDCYNFTECVWRKNTDTDYWEQNGVENGMFGWVKEYQTRADSPRAKMPDVGVPQGGAISGLIANIVINRVDGVISKKLHHDNDLYVRYCDDMLLLSTNKRRCGRLFRLYTKEIKKAKLMPHPRGTLEFGTSDYWNTKTKPVYKWVQNDLTSGSRWIGFVGYEMNRMGEIRIRKASLKKEKRKQRKVINDIFSLTYRKHRVNDKSMTQSYRSTLVSMAVGRVTLWNYQTLKNEYCWINGFRMLNDNPTVRMQIRDLDRCRNRVIRRARVGLARLDSIVGGTIAKEGNNPKNENTEQSPVDYYGKPFSYYYHFQKKLKDEMCD